MLMPKWIFDELLFADVQLAWNLIGGEVLKRFTGEYITPIPCFQTSRCPCSPGYVILSHARSFTGWLHRDPPMRVFTECLWDFNPSTCDDPKSVQMIPVNTACDRPAATFRLIATRVHKNETKTIKIIFQGKKITELDLQKHQLQNLKVATLLFDDTGFDSFVLHMVNRVFSVDRGRIEVWVDNDVDIIDIPAQSPIGFQMYRLGLHEKNDGDRYIRSVSNVKSKGFKAEWLNRDRYKLLIRNFIPNQRKYSGEAGDFN